MVDHFKVRVPRAVWEEYTASGAAIFFRRDILIEELAGLTKPWPIVSGLDGECREIQIRHSMRLGRPTNSQVARILIHLTHLAKDIKNARPIPAIGAMPSAPHGGGRSAGGE